MIAVNVYTPCEVISEDDFVSSGEVPVGTVEHTPGAGIESSSLGPLRRYRIVAPLGKGGMAEVFLAAWEVAPQVQRPVVIKRLHTHLVEDPKLVQMFIDEARLSCGFEHDNIVKTIEVGIIDGHCCIAMEYLAGQSLQQLLRHCWSQGGMPIDLTVHIIIRALDALQYAHEFADHRGMALGIVHRDISPHNILITNTGQVKLLDFGVAKAKSQESRTATGYVKGKLAYIAPEQAQARAVDQRADLWSVGVVLWEMLVGTRLFRAETDAATLMATLGADIADPSSLRAEVSPELDRIVMRALQRSPIARYQSATAMKRDLEQFAVSIGSHASTVAVAQLMQDCFAKEIAEQQKLVFDLLEHDSAPNPVTQRTYVSTQSSKISSEAALALDLTRVDGLLDQVSRSHKFLVRLLLTALMFVTAVASFVIFTLLTRQSQPTERRATVALATNGTHGGPGKSVATEALPNAEPAQPEVPASPLSPPATSAAETWTSSGATATHSVVKRAGNGKVSTVPSASMDVGTLNLDTAPWSVVSVNGRVLGQTPLMGVKLPAGTHILTLRNADLGLETQYSVNIEPGKTVARRIGLQ